MRKIWPALGLVGGALVGDQILYTLDRGHLRDRIARELPEGSSLLNIGCKGWYLYRDKFSKFRVTNIDIVEREAPNFFLADVRDLSIFDDNSFDAVLASHILEHIRIKDVPIAMSEIERVAKSPEHIYILLPRWYMPGAWSLWHHWILLGSKQVKNPFGVLAYG